MIIGLIGRSGVGKTTAADILTRQYGCAQVPFAGSLKSFIAQLGLFSWRELTTHKTPDSKWFMQQFGTELVRKIDPDFWVRKWSDKVMSLGRLMGVNRIVVDDVRMPNEHQAIKLLKGQFIRIERPDFSSTIADPTHATEVNSDGLQADYVVLNDRDLTTFENRIHGAMDWVMETI